MGEEKKAVVQCPPQVVVVILPLPAQGHLNQLMHLARIISTKGISVHYVGSATHNRQAKDRVHGWNPSTKSNFHFHDFRLPQVVNPPPDPHASNKFPSQQQPTFEASLHLRQPLALLLNTLSSTSRRVVVIHDSLLCFAAEEASFLPNAEAYCFHSISAFALLYLSWEAMGKPADEVGKMIPNDLPCVPFEDCFTESFSDFVSQNGQWRKFDVGNLFNSCDAIEGKFIDFYAQQESNKKLWAIGPLNPVTFDSTGQTQHNCLEWLDKQPPSSVVYVSFGTSTSLSDEQITQLAIGLQHSEQRFIWVLRDADRGDIHKGEVRKAQLPDGFEERVEGVRMVVRDWAPQLQILAHSSTGGFMSHCGWNSCMESLSMGVPIAAWPMHSDQPRNAMLVTEILKVGMLVREWAHHEELVSSVRIASSIRKLMVSKEGNAMRKMASALGVDIRQAVSVGRTSNTQTESFLNHMLR